LTEKFGFFSFLMVLPLIDVDGEECFERFSCWTKTIGDGDFSLASDCDGFCSSNEIDDKESSSRFFVWRILSWSIFVGEFDDGTSGVENKSSKSTDCSTCVGKGDAFDGGSRKSMNGSWDCSLVFDIDNEWFCSCSCSDIDGVDIDDSIVDERFSRSGESKYQRI